MSVELATIHWHDTHSEWRLSAPNNDKQIGLPGFNSIRDPDDVMRVDAILMSWGYDVDPSGWHEDNGKNVVVVIQRQR